MSSRIVHSFAPILLVGGANVPRNVVLQASEHANCVIGVDSGTQAILSAGLMPDHIMGDLDSVTDLPPGVPVHELADQNQTDLQKTLNASDAPLYIGAGFLGGRLDHQLAAFSAIICDPRPIVLVDETQLVFHTPPHVQLDLPDGCWVAFYPMRPVRADIAGVAYPVIDAAMEPGGLISTSNQVGGGPVRVHRTGAGLLTMLPVQHLGTVITALTPVGGQHG